MFLGYNTDLYYNGNTYHIQTEDSGLKNPVITSLIYLKGEIIAYKKISYDHILNEPDSNEKIKRLMEQQHKGMIKELLEGKYMVSNEQQGEEIE